MSSHPPVDASNPCSRLPRSEIQDSNGNDRTEYLRPFEGRCWYLKNSLRELLGYRLGAGEINVAEVRFAPPEWGLPRDRVIVRVAQETDLLSLPLQDLNEAVASELVFSLWIRRRDTHAFNRAYVGGLPVFFDHSTALFGDRDDGVVEHFLRDGDDSGYVPRWRVTPQDDVPTTESARELCRTNCALHVVRDLPSFWAAFDSWVDQVAGRDLSGLEALIQDCSFPDDQVGPVSDLLRQSQRELPELAERVKEFLEEPIAT